MTEHWRDRLQRLITERQLGMKELSLRAGLGATAVRDLLKRENRDIIPKVTTIQAIADALGMSLDELYNGHSTTYVRIPIAGIVSAGEGWSPVDDGHAIDDFELKLEPGEPVAVEVRGNSMTPVYRSGDVLIGSKRAGTAADNLIGLDCIVTTDDGRRYVKFLMRGTVRGRFNLRSYNPAIPDVENVKLAWAAPIVWVKRTQR